MAARLARLTKFGPELAGLAVLALVVLLQQADMPWLERVRLQVFDVYQAAAPRAGADAERVAIVDIDEESIARLGQWPWPRTELAELTRRLGEAGATVVAYDIVFSEPDRTSPAEVAARYARAGQGAAVIGALAELPDHDALLAASFAQTPVVAGYFFIDGRRGRDVEPKAGFTLHGSLPAAHVPSYDGTLLPLPGLEAAAAGLGFVSLDGDADGIVRRVPLAAIHRGTLVPALSLEAVRVALGAGSPNLLTSDGSGETAEETAAAVAVRLDGLEIPVDDRAEMWVHFPRVSSRSTLPAWAIVTGALSDDSLKRAVEGRIVFVGGSAVGLQDLVSTPLSDNVGGVTVHAAATEQILAGNFLERPDWALGLELVLVLVLGSALSLLLPRLGATKGALAALLGIAGVIAASWMAFVRLGYLFDPTYPVLALVAVYSVQTVAVFYREERQRRYIHAAFDRYLSPEMVRQIAADPGKLELGGEERDMSVLMCDIRGFSRISERLGPREVIDFLIAFLTPMSEILLARKATLDKYIGDAILAFWNAPLDDPDHHANAARAALAMVAKSGELNRTMPGREGVVWPGEVRIGIGLNSGLCCVGNMGSRQRLSYSLIGDTVNVASRLEGLTKLYGVPIVAGHALAERLDGFALFELDRVRVVGRDAPEGVFALLGDETMRGQASFARLARAHAAVLEAYRAKDWDAAETALAVSRPEYEAHAISGVHELFAERIAALRALPPDQSWDGVFRATQK
jgi:adenylate cyclase